MIRVETLDMVRNDSGRRFPSQFLWGAATSAFQIEGSPLADGAGPSDWYRFTHTPGRILGGGNADVACDHYRRWEEDVQLMRWLGLQAYRFSLSWSRILPGGTGAVNARGLAFYDRLIDALLLNGIQPSATLFHWDLPAALGERGGWLNRDSVHWFADYAEICFRAFGDRVQMWTTLNEPGIVTEAGYLFGVNAPGHRSLFEPPRVAHHLLCAHGSAVQRFRAGWRGSIGLVVNHEPKHPATRSTADVAAAARADRFTNRHYLDPVFLGRYPDDMRELYGEAWIDPPAEDLEQIAQPLDFLGINYYTRNVVAHDDGVPVTRARAVRVPDQIYTETGWEVTPETLTQLLVDFRARYGDLPLYVTENGAAFYDPPRPVDGRVDDPLRVHYLRAHLNAVADAIAAGVDVRGYFAWSLLDNFEWASGTNRRFGLVHVDFASQQRTPKASAHFYRDVIRTRGAAVADPASGDPVGDLSVTG